MIIVFSMILALLGFSVYLFQKYISYYFCGNSTYYTAYRCISIYDNVIIYLYIIFIGASLLFSILILIREYRKNIKLIMFVIVSLIIGILLSLLIWDDSSGFMGFNINFGPIVLIAVFSFITILISSFAWGYLLKKRYILVLPFILFILFSIFNIESLHNYIYKSKNFKPVIDCNNILLEVGRNACLFNKDAHKNIHQLFH